MANTTGGRYNIAMALETTVLALCVMLLVRVGQMLLVCGAVRSKNAASVCVRLLLDLSVVALVAWAIAGVFIGVGGRWIDLWSILDLRRDAAGLLIVPIALIATASWHGAAAERSRLAPLLALSAMTVPLLAIAWQVRTRIGLPDSGIGMASLFGGAASLVTALIVGPRKGKFNRDLSVNFLPGHNVALQVSGVLVLLIGIAAVGRAPEAVLLACSSATLAGAAFGKLRFGKIDTGLTLAAALAGAVAGGVSLIEPWVAVLCGLVAGAGTPWVLMTIETRLRVDDTTASAATFLTGGAVGLLANCVSVLAFGWTTWSLAWLLMIVLLPATGAALALATMTIFRSARRARTSESEEYDGADLTELDVNAYPDFQQNMIKSYHLREV